MIGRVRPGRPYPLGVRLHDGGAHVAVAAPVADRVDLCLFDDEGAETRIALPACDAGVWHGFVPGMRSGQRYGFRVHGPWNPAAGERCNPAKLLIDPYARSIEGGFDPTGPVTGHDPTDPSRPDPRDSAPWVPRSVVVPDPVAADVPAPRRALADTVIYELHVRGFTARHPDIPPALRGTYAGLAHPAAIAHLRELGVTAVELLPVHTHLSEPFLAPLGLTDYWGYNTLGYFAPHAGYSAAARAGRRGGDVQEFRDMVDALHAAGIQVFLDVVYNHTAEGDESGPTVSLRGLDNAAYYRLDPADRSRYIDTTGCGNALNVANPVCLRLIMDSLRFWATTMGVDGFRFDLAPSLARAEGEFSTLAAFFDLVAQDPVLTRTTLIAEPWDVGQGDSYDLGRFPAGWSEWNGRFRDTVRDAWRSRDGILGDLATRLAGSSDLYAQRGRGADASVNILTVHDGFTLADLVSYDRKHNEAHGQGGIDGTDDNRSWNSGVEGPTDDPAVRAVRDVRRRSMLATLLLSRGVPLLLGGDDIGRTQHGDNNAYCLDDETTWWDWEGADHELHRFTASLIALRMRHPVLRRRRYSPDPAAIGWFAPDGAEMTVARWRDPAARGLAMVLDGTRDPDLADDGTPLLDDDLALLVNTGWDPVVFATPWAPDGCEVLCDTGDPARAGRRCASGVAVEARALVLVRCAPQGALSRAASSG